MLQALAFEKIFVEYFHNVKAALRKAGAVSSTAQKMSAAEDELLLKLKEAQDSVHAALCDDLDTPRALLVLADLIKTCNRYLEAQSTRVVTIALQAVARYITHILRCFGLVPHGVDIGFPLEGASESGGQSRETVLTPILDLLTTFRHKVRLAAIENDRTRVLQLADELRDDVLPDLGVRLEDKGTTESLWKLDDPAVSNLPECIV